jgi:hypothetical protein
VKGYSPLDRNSRTRADEELFDEDPIENVLLGRERRQREPWHIGRDIPLALILALLAQTGGAVWWASGLSAKLDRAIEQITEFKLDRYTKDDGRRDQALLFQMLEGLRQSDRDLERRVLNCEQATGGGKGR